MLKNPRSGPELSKAPILFAICLVFVFFFACFLVYRNNHFVETSLFSQLSNSFVRAEIGRSFIHDGFFFRRMAERFVYYPHDPALIIKSHNLSVMRSPAEHRNFVSYAEYLSTRSCCAEVAVSLMQEGARRAPSEPEVQLKAGAFLFLKGHKQNSIYYIHRLFELNPSAAYSLYQHLVDHKVPMSQLIVITPSKIEPLIELAKFLASKGDKGKVELRRVMGTLLAMQIEPEQRFAVAKQAFYAGDLKLAEREAINTLRSTDSPADPLQLLFDIYWSEKDYDRFEKTAHRLEQVHRDSGKNEDAARIAVVVAEWLSRIEDRSKTFERLMRIVKTYPTYAPTYYLLANFYRGESDERMLFYFEKAAQLDPGNLIYNEELAGLYLKLSMIDDAQKVYERMLQNRAQWESAYLGIARCEEKNDRLDEAIEVLIRGIETNSRSEKLYLELGRLYDLTANYKRAAEAYLEYSNLTSQKVDGYNLTADAFKNAGDFNSANENYRQVLALDPKNRHALEGLASVGVSPE